MADTKYANLPGIALDEPDVFETNVGELPEVDQHLDAPLQENADVNSDSVETLYLSATEAFGRFKGKHLDANGVDFSDRLRPAKQKNGYVSWSGDYENAPSGEEETALQKYQRLNCEIRELREELSKSPAAVGSDGDRASSLSSVALQVSALQDELAGLKMEESALGTEFQDPRQADSTKLLAHLQSFMKGRQQVTKNVASTGGAGNNVTYELMMKPETARLHEREVIARHDKRLDLLEKVLGADQEAMSSLSVETSQKSVLGAISVLSARTALLEPGHLDHIEGRLAALQAKMNSIAEKKPVTEDQEKEHKLNEIHALVQRIQSMGNVLPSVVDRLDALQEMHEQALQFSKTLAQLDSVQQKLVSNLGNNDALLKETQNKFAVNLAGILENFQNVEQRLTKLGK